MGTGKNTDRDMYRNEVRVLRRVGYNLHTTVEEARAAGGRTALARLMGDGAIVRDPEWTGCVILTSIGQDRLDGADADLTGAAPCYPEEESTG
jgi:hypothetical protein